MLRLAYDATSVRGSMRLRQRQSVSIENLLQWCYREELPKRDSRTVMDWRTCSYWEKLQYLGTKVDEGRYTDEPGFISDSEPHDDAKSIHTAVSQLLCDVTLVWEHACERIMGELLPYAPADDPVLRRMQFSPRSLVMLHAKMGTRPKWDLGPLRLERVQGPNGKPITRGITAGNRYGDGSHCPLRLDPPAREIACARAEYEQWYLALCYLAKLFNESWKLKEYQATPPTASALPWISDTERKPTIYHDNRKRIASN